jgi:hypothetical protein
MMMMPMMGAMIGHCVARPLIQSFPVVPLVYLTQNRRKIRTMGNHAVSKERAEVERAWEERIALRRAANSGINAGINNRSLRHERLSGKGVPL